MTYLFYCLCKLLFVSYLNSSLFASLLLQFTRSTPLSNCPLSISFLHWLVGTKTMRDERYRLFAINGIIETAWQMIGNKALEFLACWNRSVTWKCQSSKSELRMNLNISFLLRGNGHVRHKASTKHLMVGPRSASFSVYFSRERRARSKYSSP